MSRQFRLKYEMIKYLGGRFSFFLPLIPPSLLTTHGVWDIVYSVIKNKKRTISLLISSHYKFNKR